MKDAIQFQMSVAVQQTRSNHWIEPSRDEETELASAAIKHSWFVFLHKKRLAQLVAIGRTTSDSYTVTSDATRHIVAHTILSTNAAADAFGVASTAVEALVRSCGPKYVFHPHDFESVLLRYWDASLGTRELGRFDRDEFVVTDDRDRKNYAPTFVGRIPTEVGEAFNSTPFVPSDGLVGLVAESIEGLTDAIDQSLFSSQTMSRDVSELGKPSREDLSEITARRLEGVFATLGNRARTTGQPVVEIGRAGRFLMPVEYEIVDRIPIRLDLAGRFLSLLFREISDYVHRGGSGFAGNWGEVVCDAEKLYLQIAPAGEVVFEEDWDEGAPLEGDVPR